MSIELLYTYIYSTTQKLIKLRTLLQLTILTKKLSYSTFQWTEEKVHRIIMYITESTNYYVHRRRESISTVVFSQSIRIIGIRKKKHLIINHI